MEGKDLKWVYDTVLSTPGMGEAIKIDLKVNRKMVLLLVDLLERGISSKGDGLPEVIGKESIQEVKNICSHFLEKAGLIELNGHLKNMASR